MFTGIIQAVGRIAQQALHHVSLADGAHGQQGETGQKQRRALFAQAAHGVAQFGVKIVQFDVGHIISLLL